MLPTLPAVGTHQLTWTQPGPDDAWEGAPPGKWSVARAIPRSETKLDASGPHSAMPRVMRRYWLAIFLAEDSGEFETAEEAMANLDQLWDAYVAERRL